MRARVWIVIWVMGVVGSGCSKCTFVPQTTCGNNVCETGERCETCPQDCGKCNVCGDGKCSVTEVENCNTCPRDCACPDLLVCARELTLPPRCILPTTPACPNGAPPQSFTFCLSVPGKPLDDCANRYETTVTACSHDQAQAIAKSSAANYNIQDGTCPACCANPPCQ